MVIGTMLGSDHAAVDAVARRPLARALRRGDIAGAGIDVFEEEPKVHPELVKCRNAVITPHIASATIETRTAMGTLAASNLIAVLNGKKPPTSVNPEVWRKRRK